MIEPLASANDNYQIPTYTNLSRAFSLSILDENGEEIGMKINLTDSIEFFIPRDPNLIIPPMFLQNVTFDNEKHSLFNYHFINFSRTNPNLTFSVHFEMQPLNSNLSYLLIYKFDDKPQLNSMDNWTILHPSSEFSLFNSSSYLSKFRFNNRWNIHIFYQ
jgi:hypothetical protein